jgi:AraC-like DNA-binding protein
VFSPLEVKPVDRDTFDAAFSTDVLGPLVLAKTFSLPATIEHTERHVRQTHERRVFLVMPIQGRILSSHYGHEAVLEEGDFALTDSFAPSRTMLPEPNDALAVCVPYDTLTTYIPNPEGVFGMRMSGNAGFGHTVNTMLRSLWVQLERATLPGCFGPGIAKNFLELVATAYALEHATEIAECSLSTSRRGQVKRFIEMHLRDSDLTATAIADALGLSPRYIRMVFAGERESISDYILRRRLEECAVQLTNVLWLGRSITDTAFEWGFSSMAHFTRAFKEHFSVTPTEYRRIQGASVRSAIPS